MFADSGPFCVTHTEIDSESARIIHTYQVPGIIPLARGRARVVSVLQQQQQQQQQTAKEAI